MSWAEDNDIDWYEPSEIYYSEQLDEWTDRHGNTKKIHSLETSHIENIIRRINAKKRTGGQGNKLESLWSELDRRAKGGTRVLTKEEFVNQDYEKYVKDNKELLK